MPDDLFFQDESPEEPPKSRRSFSAQSFVSDTGVMKWSVKSFLPDADLKWYIRVISDA